MNQKIILCAMLLGIKLVYGCSNTSGTAYLDIKNNTKYDIMVSDFKSRYIHKGPFGHYLVKAGKTFHQHHMDFCDDSKGTLQPWEVIYQLNPRNSPLPVQYFSFQYAACGDSVTLDWPLNTQLNVLVKEITEYDNYSAAICFDGSSITKASSYLQLGHLNYSKYSNLYISASVTYQPNSTLVVQTTRFW